MAAALVYMRSVLGLETTYSFTAVVNTPSQRGIQRLGGKLIGEFDHPALPAGDWLQRHVLYRIACARIDGGRGHGHGYAGEYACDALGIETVYSFTAVVNPLSQQQVMQRLGMERLEI